MSGNYKAKMAAISGASHALKYKESHPKATDSEVIQYVTSMTDEIMEKIEDKEA